MTQPTKLEVDDSLVLAFAGASLFLKQPYEAQRVVLLVSISEIYSPAGTTLTNIAVDDEAGLAVIGFDIADDGRETTLRFRCNLACFAFIIVILAFGLKVYVNRNRKGEGGKPYLKALALGDENARIVMARAIAGAEGHEGEEDWSGFGEEVGYADGDPTNLTHANLIVSKSPRVEKGTLSWVGIALLRAQEIAAALVPGTAEQKHRAADDLLKLAIDCMDEERSRIVPPDAR